MIEAGREDVPPELEFTLLDAQPRADADDPALELTLQIDAGERELRGAALNVRVQIRAERRRYSEAEKKRLWELFGAPEQWVLSLGPLPWGRVRSDVPPFVGCTTTELQLPCRFDFGAAAPKYLNALDDGVVPLELLFSGTLSWTAADGRPQTAMLPWDREATFRMPVSRWREVEARP